MKLSRHINTFSNRDYHVKDYRGDVRAVIGDGGTLKEVNNYYPYGALMAGGSQAVQPYKYGTKELDRQNGLDWYDSQARWYDALSGRTPTMDPLSEKYYSISPYAWCGGNPVNRIDNTGCDYYSVNSGGYFTLIQSTNDEFDRIFSMTNNMVNYSSSIDVPKSFIASEQTEVILTSSDWNGIEKVGTPAKPCVLETLFSQR